MKTILTNNLTENTNNEAIRHRDRQNIAKGDKLTLNGVELALKEVTFGDTTLSVLAAV